jgi:hypothetical protein
MMDEKPDFILNVSASPFNYVHGNECLPDLQGKFTSKPLVFEEKT